MKKCFQLLTLAFTLMATECAVHAAEIPDLTQHFDPFIGTSWTEFPTGGVGYDNGNTFPGAAFPMGMVQWSPDTPPAAGVVSGYLYLHKIITGFPLTHFSGRGVKYLQDIPFLPIVKAVETSPGTHWNDYSVGFAHTREESHPGYYGVTLDSDVKIELTATPRSGMARIQFPAGGSHNLLIRADSQVNIVNAKEITGFHASTIGGGSRPYTVYFAAQFDQPFATSGTWDRDTLKAASNTATATSCGAFVTFDGASTAPVQVKVGLSFVSIENAQANLAAENPGWNFDAIRRDADQAWNTQLNRIQVTGGTKDETRTFYTALYHCFFHPNLLDDVNGQYPGMDGALHTVEKGHHQCQNIPAWDQYRSHAALRALLTPNVMADVAQSLVNYAQQDAKARPASGGLPRWQQINRNSAGMVGDGDCAIIATAYAFGVKDFDTAGALAAMHKGASVAGTTSDGHAVRDGLADYIAKGYVPTRASVTLEYCVADFAISQFAAALGDKEKHDLYLSRAQNWKNLFNPATGYLQPRDAAGAFSPNPYPSVVF